MNPTTRLQPENCSLDSPISRYAHPGDRLVQPDEWPAIASEFQLSIREWEVTVMLFRGRTREAIARKLGISKHTVRTYLEQIHNKFGVQDRVELVLRVIEVRDQLRGSGE